MHQALRLAGEVAATYPPGTAPVVGTAPPEEGNSGVDECDKLAAQRAWAATMFLFPQVCVCVCVCM